jgi:mycofactocin system glycosyltransferase
VRTLPALTGVRVHADSSLRRASKGMTVWGGSPVTVIRLTREGARRLDVWLAGEPIGAGAADQRLLRRLLDVGLVHPIGFTEGRRDRALTVVIPVHDDRVGLERLLAGLGGSVPVVVVDDGSADHEGVRTVAVAAGAACHRRGSQAGGPGPARNHGLRFVDTELVAFVDADVTVDPGVLEVLIQHFDDPEVVAVAPRVRGDESGGGVLAAHDTEHGPLDLGPEPSPVGPGHRVSYVPAACLVVRTSVARDLGGFDPGLRWGEDVDFVWRMVAEGHTVRYDPAVVVSHRARRDPWAWLDQRRRYGSAAAPLAARHGSAVAPVRCSPWSAAAWSALAAGHPALGAGVVGASAVALASRLAHVDEGRRLAVRIAVRGHLQAALSFGRAIRRAWWPIALALGASSRRLRRSLGSALVVSLLVESNRASGSARLVTTAGLTLADDLAYGAGVWEGMWKERSCAAIRPELVL